jgi:hypothetical protein
MQFTLDTNGKVLARTPRILRTLLEQMPDDLVQSNYGPGTWSPHQVVGHLIHGEKIDWMPRARLIMEQGDAVTFEPFDRNGIRAVTCHLGRA